MALRGDAMQYLILLFLSVLCASIPMVVMLATIWWLDRYDREPVWLVALTFLWGAVGAIALSLITGGIGVFALEMTMGSGAAETMSPILIAPLTEEPTKALFLFLVATSKHFDNTTDGFVYGAAAGLGFAMTENFMYFSVVAAKGGVELWVQSVIVRTMFSAVMHAAATSVVGAAIGWARFRRTRVRIVAITAGLGIAIFMHGIWNGFIVASGIYDQPSLSLVGFGILPLEVIAILAIFLICVDGERRVIRRHLYAEAYKGVLPRQYVPIMASYLKRRRIGWLPPGIPQERVVTTATSLAFNLEKARVAPERSRGEFVEEADRLRVELRALLVSAQT